MMRAPGGAPKNLETSTLVRPKVLRPMMGEAGLLPAGELTGEEVEGLVGDDGSAEGGAGLDAGVGGLVDGGERVGGLDVAVAQEAEGAGVGLICAGFGDDIDDASGGAAVLGVEAVGDDLELLHGVLADGGAGAAGDVVAGVGAVDVDGVGAGAGSAEIEAGGRDGSDGGRGVAGDLRVGEGEVDVVAAVGGEVGDAELVDGGGLRGALGLDDVGAGGDGDGLVAADGEDEGELGLLAGGEDDVLLDELGEGERGGGDGVGAGRQEEELVVALPVGGGGAGEALGGVGDGDGGVGMTAPEGSRRTPESWAVEMFCAEAARTVMRRRMAAKERGKSQGRRVNIGGLAPGGCARCCRFGRRGLADFYNGFFYMNVHSVGKEIR